MTFDAEWYCLLHTGSKKDMNYYVAAAAKRKSVLEFGCGNGRLTLPIAQSGIPITGVDNSPGMLVLLEESKRKLNESDRGRITPILGDMRNIKLDQKFDLVMIPYNGLLCLLDDDAVTRCLLLAAQHLTRHGELIFDIYDVPSETDADEDESEFEPDYELLSTLRTKGMVVEVFERAADHPDPRRFDTTYQYRKVEENGRFSVLTEYTIEQRCIFKEDIPRLLGSAGFDLVSLTGDFVDAPITDDTEQLIIRARLTSIS